MSQEKPNIQCLQCGASFRCGAKAGEKTCWCFALPQKFSVPKADSQVGCLCPNCLEAALKETMVDSEED